MNSVHARNFCCLQLSRYISFLNCTVIWRIVFHPIHTMHFNVFFSVIVGNFLSFTVFYGGCISNRTYQTGMLFVVLQLNNSWWGMGLLSCVLKFLSKLLALVGGEFASQWSVVIHVLAIHFIKRVSKSFAESMAKKIQMFIQPLRCHDIFCLFLLATLCVAALSSECFLARFHRRCPCYFGVSCITEVLDPSLQMLSINNHNHLWSIGTMDALDPNHLWSLAQWMLLTPFFNASTFLGST